MIRAVFFDFYGVWAPDKFAEYLAEVEQYGWSAADELHKLTRQYFQGKIGPPELAEAFRYYLHRTDIDAAQFALNENAVYPAIVSFMRGLHGHFLKVGILAELGAQELKLLSDFNAHNQVFEVIAGPLAFQLNQPLLTQEVFARALQAIGEPPKSCLVVSGNQEYLRFAESLGIAILQYKGYNNLLPELEQLLSTTTEA